MNKMMKRIMLGLLLTFWLGQNAWAFTKLFNEANDLYKQGEYERAIQVYEEVLNQGQVSGALYYNLGNSYFKKGQLGPAILNYERAFRYIPNDSDLKANYQFALAQVKRSSSVGNQPLFAQWFKAYQSQFTTDQVAKLLFGLYCAGLGFYLITLFFHLKSWPTRLVLAGLVLVFLFHLGIYSYKVSIEQKMAIIMVQQEGLFEPQRNATKHFTLYEGMKVQIVEERDQWMKIKRVDGKRAWVPTNVLSRI